jgi:hypothetical protein
VISGAFIKNLLHNQPRNINVSFTNNNNVAIDVIIFTFYSDQLTIDVETGIVTK